MERCAHVDFIDKVCLTLPLTVTLTLTLTLTLLVPLTNGRIKVVAHGPYASPNPTPSPTPKRTPTPTPTPNLTVASRWWRTADGGCCGSIRWSRV